MKHSDEFVQIVEDAKNRIKEVTVEESRRNDEPMKSQRRYLNKVLNSYHPFIGCNVRKAVNT